MQVTTQLLKETAAGKRIRKLTKHPNSDIVAAAIKVVEAWKDAVRLEQCKCQSRVVGVYVFDGVRCATCRGYAVRPITASLSLSQQVFCVVRYLARLGLR